MDERRTAYTLRLVELDEAKDEAELAKLELKRAEAELEVRRIRSPIDGVVIARSRDPGEYLRDDGSVLTLAQLDPLRVEVFLPQVYYGMVAVGDIVQILPESTDGQAIPAEVSILDPIFDASSATFGVRLSLSNPDRRIVGGVRCLARF